MLLSPGPRSSRAGRGSGARTQAVGDAPAARGRARASLCPNAAAGSERRCRGRGGSGGAGSGHLGLRPGLELELLEVRRARTPGRVAVQGRRSPRSGTSSIPPFSVHLHPPTCPIPLHPHPCAVFPPHSHLPGIHRILAVSPSPLSSLSTPTPFQTRLATSIPLPRSSPLLSVSASSFESCQPTPMLLPSTPHSSVPHSVSIFLPRPRPLCSPSGILFYLLTQWPCAVLVSLAPLPVPLCTPCPSPFSAASLSPHPAYSLWSSSPSRLGF